MPPIEGKPAGKREEPMGEGVRGGGSPEGRKAAFDGKKYLERTLQKLPGEMMKVVQIPQTNSYRVNWYDPAKAGSGSVPGLSAPVQGKVAARLNFPEKSGKYVVT